MDTVLALMAGLGLAAACGFRVFVPLLITGIAARSGHLNISNDFQWLASDPALLALGLATVLEITAYFVPWLDHALDTLASPAAVVAGAMLVAAVATDLDPFLRWTLAIIAGGGIAATVQAATVAARGASFTISGGLSNPVVAAAELGGAAITSATAVVAPGLALLGLVAVGLLLVTHWSRRRRAAR